MKKPITDVKVERPLDCPFSCGDTDCWLDRDEVIFCSDVSSAIPDEYPLRRNSVTINIGSKGLASVDGRVKG